MLAVDSLNDLDRDLLQTEMVVFEDIDSANPCRCVGSADPCMIQRTHSGATMLLAVTPFAKLTLIVLVCHAGAELAGVNRQTVL
jgi:hypothetical protein